MAEVLFSVKEIAEVTNGQVIGSPAVSISGVVIDSRLARPGDLFVAIPGQRTDGHDHLPDAFARGSAAALVQRFPEDGFLPCGVLVDNTIDAMGTLARHHLSKVGVEVVGVTGSVGKTTTKEMIYAVLRNRFRCLKNEGNLNTEIGLPLTIFNLAADHQVAVFEMAMRGPGEIKKLTQMAPPKIGVITNVGHTHLELLGSRENIASAKAELLDALPSNGVAVLNADDPMVMSVARRARCERLTYAIDADATIKAKHIVCSGGQTSFALTTPWGSTAVTLNAAGPHNVLNALAAAAVGLVFRLNLGEIAHGLQGIRPLPMRGEIIDTKIDARIDTKNVTIMNDTYNASPASAKAAISSLMCLPAVRRIAVLGDMLELGRYETAGHEEVGECAARAGVDHLICVGERSRYTCAAAIRAGMDQSRVIWCASNVEATQALENIIQSGDAILVKGSRAMKMEEIVSSFTGGGRS